MVLLLLCRPRISPSLLLDRVLLLSMIIQYLGLGLGLGLGLFGCRREFHDQVSAITNSSATRYKYSGKIIDDDNTRISR
jgi:hypothetical protein